MGLTIKIFENFPKINFHKFEKKTLFSCDSIGDLSDLLFCITCGCHYHARCISSTLTVTGEVRAGWQCPDCKTCQTCLEPRDEEHMIICDACDKVCYQVQLFFLKINLRRGTRTVWTHAWTRCRRRVGIVPAVGRVLNVATSSASPPMPTAMRRQTRNSFVVIVNASELKMNGKFSELLFGLILSQNTFFNKKL